MKTNKAIKECARWLAYCMEIGWEKKDLDMLEKLWWKYHDTKGKIIQKSEEPAKGAEEILTVYFKHNNCSDEFIKAEIDRFINCPKCRQAMEQYRAEGLREELIKFRDYCYNALIICDNKQIDEYLKQKP
jgi:hypothetical protein